MKLLLNAPTLFSVLEGLNLKRMHRIKLMVLALAGVITFSCSDEPEEKKSQNTDDCLPISSSATGEIVEGEYIVTTVAPDSGGRAASFESVLTDHGVSARAIVNSFSGSATYHVMKLNSSEVEILQNDARVASIEPDRIISVCGCFSVIEPKSVTWNVDRVGYGDGTGKTAWILDSGIDSDHPDLNVDKSRSKSFLQDHTSFEDDNGHGTHIAGIIGALNNQEGTLGVASGASLVGIKILDQNGDGRLSGLLNALAYVKSNGKAGDVVNISIGFPEKSETLESEIKSIASKGIYFALAAGNESSPAADYSPARTAGNNIYTITAVDSLNNFAGFSNYGNDVVDFAAPGVDILSTYTNGRYAVLSGTSMAAPHIAGLLLVNDGKINAAGSAVGDPDGTGDPLAHK
jgi:subtilisin